MKTTLRSVMERMMITPVSQNLETRSKNFLSPRKGRYRKFKKPFMQKMKGLASCLPNCFRSKITWGVSRTQGQVRV